MTKPTKWHVRPSKTQISLGIRPVWSESSLSAWRKLGSLATHWVHSEGSAQTGWMPWLIWVFAGHAATLLVLSCCGSYNYCCCISDKINFPLTLGCGWKKYSSLICWKQQWVHFVLISANLLFPYWRPWIYSSMCMTLTSVKAVVYLCKIVQGIITTLYFQAHVCHYFTYMKELAKLP